MTFRFLGIRKAKQGEWFRPGNPEESNEQDDRIWLWNFKGETTNIHRVYELCREGESIREQAVTLCPLRGVEVQTLLTAPEHCDTC